MKETDHYLLWSCYRGLHEDIETLIAQGGNPNIIADRQIDEIKKGYTPLLCAVIFENIECINILLKHNVDINFIATIDGYNSSHETCALLESAHLHVNEKILKPLILHGADINAQRQLSGDTVLTNCILTGNQGMVEFLLEHGADIYLKNKLGKNALDFVKQRNNPAITEMVLHYDKAIKDKAVLTKLCENDLAIDNNILKL